MYKTNDKLINLQEEDKEPYDPGCKDYFWLVCNLVETLDKDELQSGTDQVRHSFQDKSDIYIRSSCSQLPYSSFNYCYSLFSRNLLWTQRVLQDILPKPSPNATIVKLDTTQLKTMA